ncbi:MAG: CRISPR-associated endonuclease Cas6 [Bacteroidota bacterium]|nr:CRISPR-associated endonuclease Cas6 [Bacteroidota bacterium]
MKNIRILSIRFTNKMKIDEMSYLRGAINQKLSDAHIDFHNHRDDDKLAYRYPLIQYKIIDNKACLICLGHGTESIHSFFKVQNYDINIGKRTTELIIDDIKINNHVMRFKETYFTYRIHHWLALNEDNYKAYMQLRDENEKIYFLENILTGNIWSFAKNMDFEIHERIRLCIIDIKKEMVKPYKGTKMHAITLDFRTNLALPTDIGLGKGVSVGFGILAPKKN